MSVGNGEIHAEAGKITVDTYRSVISDDENAARFMANDMFPRMVVSGHLSIKSRGCT